MNKQLNIEQVARDCVDEYIISTVKFNDKYETAVGIRSGDLHTVAQYNTLEHALYGHETWYESCRRKPQEVYDIMSNKFEKL